MKRTSLLLLIFLCALHLYSLDLWINDEFRRDFSLEELRNLALPDLRSETSTLLLSDVIPLFEEVYQVEAFGRKNRIVLEEPEILKSLTLVFTQDSFYLYRGDYRFKEPERIDIWGSEVEEEKLIVLYDSQYSFIEERLEQFCTFHELIFVPIPSSDPAKELANRILQKKEIPHLVIFSDSQLGSIAPHIKDKVDFSFSVMTLFSPKDVLSHPGELNGLKDERSVYAWNAYDFRVFSTLSNTLSIENSWPSDGINSIYKNTFSEQRKLVDESILILSQTATTVGADFFIADSSEVDLKNLTCYPDFISPLFSYNSLATPINRESTYLIDKAREYLLSEHTQKLLGRAQNGFYPAVKSASYTIPSDPCIMLLNKYTNNHLRLEYSDDLTIQMGDWLNLSRLVVNSSLSIDSLIYLSNTQKKESIDG